MYEGHIPERDRAHPPTVVEVSTVSLAWRSDCGEWAEPGDGWVVNKSLTDGRGSVMLPPGGWKEASA